MPECDFDVMIGRFDVSGDHPVSAVEAFGKVSKLLQLEGPMLQILVEDATVVDETALAILRRATRLVPQI